MHLADAASSNTTETTALIVQAVAGVLSVPAVVAALTAIYRFLSPTARLTAKLKRNAELYQALPESAQRIIFGYRINRDLALLNARYPEVAPPSSKGGTSSGTAPGVSSKAAPISPTASEARRARWSTSLFFVIPIVFVVVVSVVLLFTVGAKAFQTFGVSTLVGAVGTLVFAVLGFIGSSRSKRRLESMEQATKPESESKDSPVNDG